MDNKPKKQEPLEIARINNKIELLNKLLSKSEKQKHYDNLWKWWNSLPELWHDVFLINLHYSRHYSQRTLRTIMQWNQNPYVRFKTYFKHQYKKTDFEINNQTLDEIYNLLTIDCQSFNLNSIEPLTLLPHLEFLDCSHNPLANIKPLAHKTSLRKLDLNTTKTDKNSTDVLATLTNLEFLWLFSVKEKINIPILPHLKLLIVDDNMNNLKDADKFPALEALEIRWNNDNLHHLPISKYPKLRLINVKKRYVGKVVELKTYNPNLLVYSSLFVSLEKLAFPKEFDEDDEDD